MKKYLSMLAVVAVAASAFAQGTVNFSNNGSTLVRLPDATTAVPVGQGFVQLLWAPSGTAANPFNVGTQNLTSWLAANPGWSAIEASIKPFQFPGRFLGGTIAVPTTPAGAPIQAAVASWTGNFSTFDAAVAGQAQGVGISTSFAVTTGNPTTTPPGTAAVITGAGQFGGMTLTAIPEPSTLALAGLGAAALLIFRRRK